MRLKIFVEANVRYTKENIIFFIEDFPQRVQGGDLIALADFFEDEEGFSEGQCEQIYALSYSVDFVVWEKDEKGIYLKAYCNGE